MEVIHDPCTLSYRAKRTQNNYIIELMGGLVARDWLRLLVVGIIVGTVGLLLYGLRIQGRPVCAATVDLWILQLNTARCSANNRRGTSLSCLLQSVSFVRFYFYW